ncbi:MAG: type II toxin-antitoxin system VapC family toxin [Myxococcota bacterium]
MTGHPDATRYALDTNTLIYFFRGEGQVSEQLVRHAPSQIGIPAVVLFELETGIAKSVDVRKRRQQLDVFLATVTCLSFGAAEARAAAQIRANLEKQGVPIGPMDTLIAGTALATGRVLVTRNTREFSRVEGLAVENWYG